MIQTENLELNIQALQVTYKEVLILFYFFKPLFIYWS